MNKEEKKKHNEKLQALIHSYEAVTATTSFHLSYSSSFNEEQYRKSAHSYKSAVRSFCLTLRALSILPRCSMSVNRDTFLFGTSPRSTLKFIPFSDAASIVYINSLALENLDIYQVAEHTRLLYDEARIFLKSHEAGVRVKTALTVHKRDKHLGCARGSTRYYLNGVRVTREKYDSAYQTAVSLSNFKTVIRPNKKDSGTELVYQYTTLSFNG